MQSYELIVGLEIHVELATNSKIFCGCRNAFGLEANMSVCPVCMGLPGALPVFNEEVLRLACLAGKALNCKINSYSRFDRKHYFYPDLPKSYQITQLYHPLCEKGNVEISLENGMKNIGITRIHIEEDAGKLIHNSELGTGIDMNRCGIPLIEIVTEPDLRSPSEASALLKEIRSLLVFAGASTCKMNEGKMRCDVNISIRKSGEALQTRTEIKNINSFQGVEQAILSEYERQKEVLTNGGKVVRETRRYDQNTNSTMSMRRKETIDDYRFFPEPDLPPIFLSEAGIERISLSMPEPSKKRKKRYVEELGLNYSVSEQLLQEKWISDYFEKAYRDAGSPSTFANLIVGELFSLVEIDSACNFPISASKLVQVSNMLSKCEINSNTAKRIIHEVIATNCDPFEFAKQENLFMINDVNQLFSVAEKVINENFRMVAQYYEGKTVVIKALMGKAMKLLDGKANPKLLEECILEELLKRGESKND